MKKLINTIKKIEKTLTSLEVLLKKEHNLLLNVNNNINIFNIIIEEKKKLFKTFFILNQEKVLLEKNNHYYTSIYNKTLNYHSYQIVKKCIILKELNRTNKILMNKHFYLNQRFLECFELYQTSITYNAHGNLKV